MLEKVLDFFDRHPQEEDGRINYVFVGGSSLRILEERHLQSNGRYPSEDPRVVSDVDLLSLNDRRIYEVHTTLLRDIFLSGLSLNEREIQESIVEVNVKGRKLVSISKELLVALKSSYMIDVCRNKDYADVCKLNDMGFDWGKVAEFYTHSKYFSGNCNCLAEMIKNAVALRESNPEEGYRIFAFAPQVYRLSEAFENEPLLDCHNILDKSKSLEKGIYETAKSLDSINRGLLSMPKKLRSKVFEGLLRKAREMAYRSFDSFVHNGLIPAMSKTEGVGSKVAFLHNLKIL